MQVTINGRTEKIEFCTIAELIERRGLDPDRLVVEYNLTIVRQDQWGDVRLQDGDTLELLSFVGGG